MGDLEAVSSVARCMVAQCLVAQYTAARWHLAVASDVAVDR